MTNDVRQEYFEWMYDLVTKGRFSKRNSYRKLISYLHTVEYTWLIDDDINRAEDGEEGLRQQFSYVNHITVNHELDGPCSVLEMILAMAYRCEEIMDDPAVGDRTIQWFWQMIANLGLGGMTDRLFNQTYVRRIVQRFLNRDYEPDGHGSLFIIRDCKYDLRDVETWTCMLWYLDCIT